MIYLVTRWNQGEDEKYPWVTVRLLRVCDDEVGFRVAER